MKKKLKFVLLALILLLSSIMIVGSEYYSRVYSNQQFDQIVFYLFNGVKGTSLEVIKSIFNSNIKSVIILFCIFCMFIVKNIQKRTYLHIKMRNKNLKIQIYPVKITSNHRVIYTVIVFLCAIAMAIKGFKIDEFIKNNLQTSTIYEEYYIDASTVELTFPKQKRNLVFISLESMETTLCSKENGGGWNYSVIPELEMLAMDNISFSNTNKIGGANQTCGATFTAGGLVAQTGGIPLITPATMSASSIYMGTGKCLESAYTLGDILQEHDYNLEIMMGSDGEFGGRTQYFKTNGDYKIFDVNYAIETGRMTEEDRVWWGFEDDKLFAWAKEEITNLSKEDKPFNIIIQTADTHFTDGYLSEYAENKYETQYENVYAYSSKIVYKFVQWLQEQDFYENTTIVIIGDHIGMQTEFYTSHMRPNYDRRVYNVIINSAIKSENTTNREFTTMDMFPTMLASMGVEIEGNRLGLGTNLFSEEKTLTEELGYDYLNNELKKSSNFYNNVLLGEDYYVIRKAQEMKEQEEKE